jgi:hypothetical protein
MLLTSDQEAAQLMSEGLNYVYNTEDAYYSFTDVWEHAYQTVAGPTAPRTFAEAMKRPDADLWQKAAQDEMDAHLENGTWELVKLPPGRKAIGSKWVFKVKHNSDGSIERYKARVVAKGYSQRPGLDFGETFAPTTKWASLRTIFALAALEDLELETIDISTAYLNGVMAKDHEVYMQQAEGFQQHGPEWVCRLLKGLYGLKQGGRLWYERLDQVLSGMGFKRTNSDHSVYVWVRGEVKVIVPIFVDDLTLASKSKAAIAEVKQELKKHFKVRELGPTSFLLGVDVSRHRPNHTLSLSQRQYTLDILERFGFQDCAPVTTPMDASVKLSQDMAPKTPEDEEKMRGVQYTNAVGALMYLAVCTRPDIAHAVSVLSRFNSNPGPTHWLAVKRVFRYLKGSLDYKLTFKPGPSTELFQSYVDADHGGNPDNGHSTTGYVIKMGTGAVSWSSKQQPIVALSTTEAEYVAAVSAATEVIWLRHFLSELGYSFPSPSTLHIDNQSAISVAKNPEHHGRMKHLDLRFFWLRDAVHSKTLAVQYIPTGDMPADILTKPLERVKFNGGRSMLGVME